VYAEKAEVEKSEAALKFNCMQRAFLDFDIHCVKLMLLAMEGAHQNTLENIPMVYLTCGFHSFMVPFLMLFMTGRTVLAGIQFPKAAGALAAFWSLNRVIYTLGYVTGDPAKVPSIARSHSAFSRLCLLCSVLEVRWVELLRWVRQISYMYSKRKSDRPD
jgi:hypothetical protein